MISPTMPASLECCTDRSAWNTLVRGVLRGAVLVLVLVFVVIAGSPRDRFPAMSGSDGLALSDGSSVLALTGPIANAAMADLDDGLDEAGRIVVPSLIVGRTVSRGDGRRAALADNAVPMVPERPPRTI